MVVLLINEINRVEECPTSVGSHILVWVKWELILCLSRSDTRCKSLPIRQLFLGVPGLLSHLV
jgi:hypothetical protein